MAGWRRLGEGLSRRTGLTLAVAGAVTVLFGIGLGRLDFATGQDSYIDPASQVAHDNEQYQSLFGGENMVVLFTVPDDRTVVDMFSAANLDAFAEIEAELGSSPQIEAVISPTSLLTWTQDMITSGVATDILGRTTAREPDAAAVALRQQDMTVTALRFAAAGEQDFANPDWLRFLIFGNDGFQVDAAGQLVAPPDETLVVRRPLQAFIRDAHHAILAAVLVGNADLDELAAGSAAVEAAVAGRAFENATVTITGTPTFLTEINDSLQSGMLMLGGIAVAVMTVILVVTFGVRWRLLPLLAMVVGVVWGFGAFGFTGTKLSLVTIAGLPILIGLGIEFAIQVQNRIEEERARAGKADPFGEALARHGSADGRRHRRRRDRLRDRAHLPGADGPGLRRLAGHRHHRPPRGRHRVADHGHRGTRAALADHEAAHRRMGRTDRPGTGQPAPGRAGPAHRRRHRAARGRPPGRGRHAHRERPDQLGGPVEPDDQERPAARGRDRTGDHARHLHRDRDDRWRRRLHRSDGRLRRRSRRSGPGRQPDARRGVEPADDRRLADRRPRRAIDPTDRRRSAAGLRGRPAGAAAVARRRRRQRGPGAVPARSVEPRAAHRRGRPGRGGDRRPRRRRPAAGERDGDRRRVGRRRRGPAGEHHGEPLGSDDRRPAARRRRSSSSPTATWRGVC